MTDDAEAAQHRVIGLAEAINKVVAGIDLAEAETAMTIAVVCEIIATQEQHNWLAAADAFAQQAKTILSSKEHTDWIKSGVRWETRRGSA